MRLQHSVSAELQLISKQLTLALKPGRAPTVCVNRSIEYGRLPFDWQDFGIDDEYCWSRQGLDAHRSVRANVCFPGDAIELGGLLHCILGCVHVQLSQAAVHEERTTPSIQGRHAVF